MTVPICMWSGPRNLSTAMMRSFGSRADCAVWDEPFFAPFLLASGKAHPGREETLAAHETDPNIVAQQCSAGAPNGKTFFFQKHMPHHMLDDFPMEWTHGARHFFLIREPARVIASYVKGREDFTYDDLGFGPQLRLFDYLMDQEGAPPPVIDSADIRRAPEDSLKALCSAINIPFDQAMLTWEPGPRPEDGAWAPYWYASVEKSSGFGPPPSGEVHLADIYSDVLARCENDYAPLWERRLRV